MSAEPQKFDSLFRARSKLGLALAGGGFRASLFHLGVLRRLAELDLLRRVEVLSTVSGGSIIGALYMLLLKRARLIDAKGNARSTPQRLTRDDYRRLVEDLDRRLRHAMRLNLRNALFWNPLGVIRVIFTPYTLGERMACLYERYLFQDVVRDLHRAGLVRDDRHAWRRLLWPGRIPLRQIRAQVHDFERGVDQFNQNELADIAGNGSAVTHVVFNATSVNSGARFWFSSSEIGDWDLGHFRFSDVASLRPLRFLWRAVVRRGRDLDPVVVVKGAEEQAIRRSWFAPLARRRERFPRRTVLLALWLRDLEQCPSNVREDDAWGELLSIPGLEAFGRTDPGRLRNAQIPAWHLRQPREGAQQILDGFSPEDHLGRFWAAVEEIDPSLLKPLKQFAATDSGRSLLMEFVLDLYALRCAAVSADSLGKDMDALTVGFAVGASACFPPVFAPITKFGIYDDAHVARLGLTDGGVFDNMGIIALLDEGCDYIIASDTSGVFETQQSATVTRPGLIGRLTSILMKDLGSWQRDKLRERRRVSRELDDIAKGDDDLRERLRKAGVAESELRDITHLGTAFHASRRLRGLAYFDIHSPPIPNFESVPLPCDRELVARTRTDLDGFGEAEIEALVRTGYATADAYVRRYMGAFKPANSDDYWNAPRELPGPDLDRARLDRVMKQAERRFFRSLALLGWWSLVPLAVTLAIAGRIGWWLRDRTATITSLAADLPHALKGLTVWDGWADAAVGWPAVVALGLLVAVFLGPIIRGWLKRPTTTSEPAGTRRLSRLRGKAGKWLLGFSGCAIFFFGWKPAAAIVGFLFVYAWVNWLFYHQPFMRLASLDAVTAKERSRA